MSFEGFPSGAIEFYLGLEADNSKAYWAAHKDVFDVAVRAPMLALTEALADEFGEAKLFRPHRDVRFSHDPSPYKTHQGAVVVRRQLGYYVEVNADGVRAGGGLYRLSSSQLAAMRQAIAEGRSGVQFDRLLTALEASGFEVHGEQLKTAPRGIDKEHPRIRWLRHKSLIVMQTTADDTDSPPIDAPGLTEWVRQVWRGVATLQPWVDAHVPPPSAEELERRTPRRRTTD